MKEKQFVVRVECVFYPFAADEGAARKGVEETLQEIDPILVKTRIASGPRIVQIREVEIGVGRNAQTKL